MNVIDQAREGYAPKNSPTRSGRSTEHQLFSETTARLRTAMDRLPQNFSGFAAAIHENRTLWNHLAAQVADDENALSTELRARIFYLAEFTSFHSRKVLRGEADAEALIEINTAVMRGLNSGVRE